MSDAKREALGARVQRLTTGLFVIGIASAVAASRLQPATAASTRQLENNVMSENWSARNRSPQQLRETGRLLGEINEARSGFARTNSKPVIHEAVRTVNQAVAAIDRATSLAGSRGTSATGAQNCASDGEPALVYLSTTAGSLLMELELSINTAMGDGKISFTSAMTQMEIVAAINAFGKAIGVEASPSEANPERVEIRTINATADDFIGTAADTYWSFHDLIYADPVGGEGLEEYKDFGRNALTLAATR